MNDQTIKREEVTVIPEDRPVAISTVGYMCIAVTWWMLGMLMAGWFAPGAAPAIAAGSLYAVGSILLVIMGILSIVYGRRTIDAIVFLGMAGLLFSLHVANLSAFAAGGTVQGTATTAGYFGWYGLVWAVFFCYLWVSTLRQGGSTIRMLFLLLFWLGALAAALSGWATSTGLEVLSGYLILISAILAFITSAVEILGPHRLFGKERVREVGPSPNLGTSTTPPPHPAV